MVIHLFLRYIILYKISSFLSSSFEHFLPLPITTTRLRGANGVGGTFQMMNVDTTLRKRERQEH